MEYVMVPVPEQYVERLTQEMLRIGIERAMAIWGPDDVVDLLREIDAGPRALLAWLAPARLSGVATSVTAAAAALHCTPHEIHDHRAAINRWAIERGRPEVLFHDTRPIDKPSGPGGVRDELLIPAHVAELVRAAARAST